MITVKDVGYKRGYSSTDHLLDDEELKDIVGCQYRSLRDARRAAERLATSSSPVWIEILFADGTTRQF